MRAAIIQMALQSRAIKRERATAKERKRKRDSKGERVRERKQETEIKPKGATE